MDNPFHSVVADASRKPEDSPEVPQPLFHATGPSNAWRQMRSAHYGPSEILLHFEVWEPPVGVMSIVPAMGVSIWMFDEPGPIQGALESRWDGFARVWVSPTLPSQRQRLIVAHELGHLMKHEIGKTFQDAFGVGTLNREEAEANLFSAELLMPTHLLEAYVRLANLVQMAEIFDVPAPVMQQRLRGLGYNV